MITHNYSKDWISCPGETISEYLENNSIQPQLLQEQLGLDKVSFNSLLSGSLEISEKIASNLALFIGSTQSFWLKRESNYRSQVKATEKLREDNFNWISSIPVKYLANHGLIKKSRSKVENIKSCLDFFEVRNSDEWYKKNSDKLYQTAFRTSDTFESSIESIVTWLYIGEKTSRYIDTDWNKERLISSISEIKKLTQIKEPSVFVPELRDILSSCGVSLAIARTPEKCRASGATFFSKTSKPIIILSFRYLSDDQLWFTIFHEIGHLVLHDSCLIFLEGIGTVSKVEEEANTFSENSLIPENMRSEFSKLSFRNWRQIPRFAKKAGISPGIVIGQLQKKGLIRPNQLNKFKVRYKWDEVNSIH